MIALVRMSFLASLVALFLPGPAQARDALVFKDEDVDRTIGDIHKPGVMVVITRQNLEGGYTLELRQSFLRRIVDSVERGPF